MAPKRRREPQTEATGSGSSLRPPTNKRIKKMETIPDNADIATRAASALDLESDEVPDNLKCPICLEVPLGEVLQCPSGHTICKECQRKSRKLICSQCRKEMSVNGDWIRCRALEDLLDSHWFLCPYRKKGCEEVLSRGDVLKHKENCVYNGEHIQICKYFDSTGEGCQFWTHILKPDASLTHLSRHFNSVINFKGEETNSFWLPVIQSTVADYVRAAVTFLENGAALMTIGWNKVGAGQVSFVCLRMDKPSPRQAQPKFVKLTFENQKRHAEAIPNMSLPLPIVPVLKAIPVLEEKLVSVNRRFLEENFLDPNFAKPYANSLRVKIDLVGDN